MIPLSASSFLKERQQRSFQPYANEERLSQQDLKGSDISVAPQPGLKDGVSPLDLHNEFVRKRMALRQPCHTHTFDLAKTKKELPNITKEKIKLKTVLVERNNIHRDCDSLLAHSELARKILAIQRGEVIPDPRQNLPKKETVTSNKNLVGHLNINSDDSHPVFSSQNFNSNHTQEDPKVAKFIYGSEKSNFNTTQENTQNELAQLKEFEAQALKEFANEIIPQATKNLQEHLRPLQNCHRAQNSLINSHSRNSFGLDTNRPIHSLNKRKGTFNARDPLLERARKVRCSILQNFNGSQVENHNSFSSPKSVCSMTVRVLNFFNNSNDSRFNHISVPCEIIEQHSPESHSLIGFPEKANTIALNVNDQILVNFIFQLPNSKATNLNVNKIMIQPGNEIIINSPVTYIGSSSFLSGSCSATRSFTDLKAAIVAFAFSIK